jgi:hypothetical protein
MVRQNGVQALISLSLVCLPHTILEILECSILFSFVAVPMYFLQSRNDEPATSLSFAREHAWFS